VEREKKTEKNRRLLASCHSSSFALLLFLPTRVSRALSLSLSLACLFFREPAGEKPPPLEPRSPPRENSKQQRARGCLAGGPESRFFLSGRRSSRIHRSKRRPLTAGFLRRPCFVRSTAASLTFCEPWRTRWPRRERSRSRSGRSRGCGFDMTMMIEKKKKAR